MTKAYSRRKLGRNVSHRMMLLRNQSNALIINEKIQTTLPKAKELKSHVEKMITLAKAGKERSYRRLEANLKNREAIKKLFEVIAPRYGNRNSGYTQVFMLGNRKGDSAQMAVIKLLQ